MTKDQALFLLSAKALLEAIAECEMGVPESALYMALGADYDRSVNVLAFLKDKKAIKVTRHLCRKGPDFDKIFGLLTDFENKINSLKQA